MNTHYKDDFTRYLLPNRDDNATGCDPEFDEVYDDLAREFAVFHHQQFD